MDALVDRFGRHITYLRVSITDRCNHRCSYCAPFVQRERKDILSFAEIARIVKTMSDMGVKKVRLTGGEPLVRKGIETLVAMLKEAGASDLAMTTNGTLLERHAKTLKKAGLDRVNISIDTLNAERFRIISGGGELAPALRAVDAAIEAGLTPVKLNTVLMRINEDEIASIMDFVETKSITARFIECMPMNADFDWKKNYVPIEEILKRDDVRERVVLDSSPRRDSSAAYTLALKSGKGTVGFVSPISSRFCSTCNRMRLTSEGRLRTCLPVELSVDLKEAIRGGAGEEELKNLVLKAALLKPEKGDYSGENSMIKIGG
jgi:cyclic pyranopterin phosphate synthase